MKKGAQTPSKDRLAKSGKIKHSPSTASSVSGLVGSLTAGVGTGVPGPSPSSFDPTDGLIPVYTPPPWSDWSDYDISQEKWTLKHPFEDPDGAVELPRSLRPLTASFKRPVEFVHSLPTDEAPPAFYTVLPTHATQPPAPVVVLSNSSHPEFYTSTSNNSVTASSALMFNVATSALSGSAAIIPARDPNSGGQPLEPMPGGYMIDGQQG
jgi:hypothetical protein